MRRSNEPVPTEHPQVFYVSVVFGVWFSGVSSAASNGGIAAALGVEGTEHDAFVHVVKTDASRGFNVTAREAMLANVTVPGAKIFDAGWANYTGSEDDGAHAADALPPQPPPPPTPPPLPPPPRRCCPRAARGAGRGALARERRGATPR